jgi:hypothetical protein
MALKLRRGLDSERAGITFDLAEPIFVTDTGRLWIGNPEAVGGMVPINSALSSDEAPELAADLDLNGNDITGTGNINITGTINATGGIDLGSGGQIASDLLPLNNNAYNLGATNLLWSIVWSESSIVRGVAEADIFQVNSNIINADSAVIFDSATSTLTVDIVTTGTVNADSVATDTVVAGSITADSIDTTGIVSAAGFVGSFFSDDSSTIIDGITKDAAVNNLVISGEVNVNGIITTSNSDIIVDSQFLTTRSYGVDDDGDNATTLAIEGYRGTSLSPLTVQVGDTVGAMIFSGYDGALGKPKVGFFAGIDTVTGTNTLPGVLTIRTHDADGLYSSNATFNSRGVFNAPVIQPGVYADATARDAAIPTPAAGMMVFVTDVTKFQGYDGSAWVNLN